jgi:hypothetical protein
MGCRRFLGGWCLHPCDGIARAVSVNRRYDLYLASPTNHVFSTDDGGGGVVSALNRTSGRIRRIRLIGVCSLKMVTASVDGKAANTRARSLSPTTGRVGFQALHRSVAIDRDDQLVTILTALLEQGDVANVQNIEAAIGEDDPMPRRSPLGDSHHQLLVVQHLLGTGDGLPST